VWQAIVYDDLDLSSRREVCPTYRNKYLA
jgi:hypothetical protein